MVIFSLHALVGFYRAWIGLRREALRTIGTARGAGHRTVHDESCSDFTGTTFILLTVPRSQPMRAGPLPLDDGDGNDDARSTPRAV